MPRPPHLFLPGATYHCMGADTLGTFESLRWRKIKVLKLSAPALILALIGTDKYCLFWSSKGILPLCSNT